ncbi:MAG: DUF1015 domain-containing protein [Thermoguttaceae bacterium]
MPQVAPMAAYRYNLAQVGSLSDVVAPPYDVIDAAFQDELYARSPYNVIRLILGKMHANDSAEDNRYTRAAKTLREWKESGVVVRDGDEAIYVYHQIYEVGGRQHTRRGFMLRCEAVPFGEGMVYPHELTMSGPKLDRLMLTTACKTNFSQIFGLYPEQSQDENNIQDRLERQIADEGLTPLEATDNLGTIHRMWIVTNPQTITHVVQSMATKPIFVADGHHRYETACNYRKQIREMGLLTPQHAANYVLMFCIAMDDPGLLVLPTHRLLRGIPPMTSSELATKLGDFFTTRVVATGRSSAQKVWDEIETSGDQTTLGLFTQKDETWTLATLTSRGAEEMDKLASDHHPEWRALGVSILHRLVIETVLGQKYDLKDDSTKPTYVHQVGEVVSELATGKYNVAALVMPATVEHIETLSLLGDRMPAKSTYFFPKLISGFVFNSLE